MAMTELPASERALGVAARCWCGPATERFVMIPELMIGPETRQGIIDWVSEINWPRESADWRAAAKRWAEHYHLTLKE